jgi:L-methionine (R)-S-oxide reductase
VLSRAAVRVDDVTKDPDYLRTHESTRAELVVPVLTTGMEVVGVIDVESDQVGAFGEQDVGALQACAAALRPLWTG